MVNPSNISQLTVVDGTGLIAGRLSSHVAKMLLNGIHVRIINADKVVISGEREPVLRDWFKKLEISSVVHPRHGPFHPRSPNGILTRMIRGMIPRRKTKGVRALGKLRVYVGTPIRYVADPKTVFDDAKASKHQSYYIPLSEISSSIGWKGDSR